MSPPQTPASDIWESLLVAEGAPYCWRAGPFALYFKRVGEDWWFAEIPPGDKGPPEGISHTEPPSESPDWICWNTPPGVKTIRFDPGLPDRPVLATPETPLTLAREASARYFVSLPVWVRFVFPEGPKDSLLSHTFPTAAMSDTWAGDFSGGRLCYNLRMPPARRPEALPTLRCRAICPLTITNRKPEPLLVDRILIYGEYLSLWLDSAIQLWTNPMEVVFSDGQPEPKIHFHSGAYPKLQNPVLRTAASKAQKSGLLKWPSRLNPFL